MRLACLARTRLAALFLVLAVPDPAAVEARLDAALGRVSVGHAGVVFPAPRRPGVANVAARSGEPPAAVTRIAPQGDDGSDRRVEPMSWYVMTATARHLDGGSDGPAALDALAGWAAAGALQTLEPAGSKSTLARSRYTLKRALLPLLAGYAVLRRDLDPPAARCEAIEAWLGRLVILAEPADGPTTAHNNHRYMRDTVLIAWGALTGDDRPFRRGLAGAIDAIGAMRPDGAWPLEVARGDRALWYQRHALASLTASAEIAAAQGIDLWAVDLGGRSLHRAVGWLLEALERPAPGQDLGFLTPRGNGRHYMAWAEAYLARFPGHPNAQRLAALLAKAPRPLIDDYSGGDVAGLVGARVPLEAHPI
jgi:poly(beta-D-mannuronate) lyase